MIEVKNLSKYYGEFKAVDGLNFRIGEMPEWRMRAWSHRDRKIF